MGKSKIIENLRISIEQDPTYFEIARTDKNLKKNTEVNEFLDEIEQKATTRAISAITEAETSINKAPTIISNAEKTFHNLRKNSVLRSNTTYEESKTKYKDAQNKLELAKRKVASGEYIALLDAKKIAEEAQKVVNESYKLVSSAIDTATNEEKRNREIEHRRVKDALTGYLRIAIILGIILAAWWPMFGPIASLVGVDVLSKIYGPEEFRTEGVCSGGCQVDSTGVTLWNGGSIYLKDTENVDIKRVLVTPESLPEGTIIRTFIGPYEFKIQITAKEDQSGHKYYQGYIFLNGKDISDQSWSKFWSRTDGIPIIIKTNLHDNFPFGCLVMYRL